MKYRFKHLKIALSLLLCAFLLAVPFGSLASGLPVPQEDTGYAAVGVVNTSNGTANVLFANGAAYCVPYAGTAPTPGAVYAYTRSGGSYTFANPTLIWGEADQLRSGFSQYDYEKKWGGWGLGLYSWGVFWSENQSVAVNVVSGTPIFIRYSATSWRVCSITDVAVEGNVATTKGYWTTPDYNSTNLIIIGDYQEGQGILPPDTDQFPASFSVGNVDLSGTLPVPSVVPEREIKADATKSPGNPVLGGWQNVYVSSSDRSAANVKTDMETGDSVGWWAKLPGCVTAYEYHEDGSHPFTYDPAYPGGDDRYAGIWAHDGYANVTTGDGVDVGLSYTVETTSNYRFEFSAWNAAAAVDGVRFMVFRNNFDTALFDGIITSDGYSINEESLSLETGDKLYFLFNKNGSITGDNVTVVNFSLFETGGVLAGDLNNDGAITMLDLIQYRNVLIGKETFSVVQLQASDINADKASDILDLLMLKDIIISGVSMPGAIVEPTIFNTNYETEDVIVADINAVRLGADPTGVKDSTKAIKSAIDLCAVNGGGTVWLPAGRYLVTDSFSIPSFVTLRGDYQNPDTGNNYGTVILAKVKNSNQEGAQPLFTIGGSAGAYGLTVYYPDQSLDNVLPYPYTFYVSGLGDSYMQQSVVNCTVINGYDGIGASVYYATPHESMTVENFKGTFLHTGAEAYNQADVGTWKNVMISNKYWANANTKLNMIAPSKESIDTYTRTNATGMVLGDLEWTEFYNLQISDRKTGINIVKGQRIEFAGSLYSVKIENCDTGIKIDSIDTRWGMVLANSDITGSSNSIVNSTSGTVKLAGVTLSGAVSGSVVADNTDLSTYSIPNTSIFKPVSKLYCLNADTSGATDISAELQALLNQASQTGGIVYLPAGKYKLSNPVAVPTGVELRGASSVATRDQYGNSGGTLILAYYGKNISSAETATALITLGENAGVRGMRFIYPENNASVGTYLYPYTIRGTGSGVYVTNCCIAAASYGVDFRSCDNHVIKRLIACCYVNTMAVGGINGIVEGCLQNATVVVRNGLNLPNWTLESEVFDDIFNPITRVSTTYILIENAQSQKVLNTFAYGVKTHTKAVNSTGTLLVNIGADNLGTGSPMLDTNGGSLTAINMMRWNGGSYLNNSTSLKLYNRLTINVSGENTIA